MSISIVSHRYRSSVSIALLLCSTTPAWVACSSAPDTAERPASVQQALADTTGPVGTWYLTANGARLQVSIQSAGAGFSGTLKDEASGSTVTLANIAWDAANRWLEFQRPGAGFFQWYRLSLVQGTAAGRFSHLSTSGKPPLTSYAFQATGWSPTYLDTATSPRTWNVTLNSRYKGVLRVDTNASGVLSGTLKVYDDSAVNGPQEELEYQLTGLSWNGTNLSFTRSDGSFTQTFTGTVSGRTISGTFSHNGSGSFPWSGARGEVLGFGLGSPI
jgi:hypothetical protein